jgi:hypothetical protein
VEPRKEEEEEEEEDEEPSGSATTITVMEIKRKAYKCEFVVRLKT